MSFHFGSWLRVMKAWLSGRRRGSPVRRNNRGRGFRLHVEALERRETPATASFAPGALLVDMGQSTQTIGNALKPYGLVYDMVTNFKVPVNWAINPAKTTFRLDGADPIPVDFTATITTGTKSYAGGSFIIDAGFLTPAVLAAINTWKAQGVVVDTLAAPLTTEVFGQVTSFPRAVLDSDNGAIAVPYYTNAGVPASSYQIGNPTNLDQCDDVYILPHADPDDWPIEWQQALYDFVVAGGGLFAGCHAVSPLEDIVVAGGARLNFLSNGGLVPFGDHGSGTPPYSYLPAAANDPIMQILNRLDAATQNGSEQIYVPTTLDWRSTTTVAVFDPDHPDNPPDGTTPFNDAAAVAYGNAFGDPTAGLVLYDGGHSLAKSTGPANVAAQRTFFNFILAQGILKAPKPAVNIPTIVAGQNATLTATISGGSGTYSYQWVSSNGGVFSMPAGTWSVGDPPITTQYLQTGARDTIRLLVTDSCGRQGIFSAELVDAPPVIDLDADNSTGATGADFAGFFGGGGVIVPAADTDTTVTDNGTTIHSAAIKLTTRPDGAAETLLIDETLAFDFGINVASDGMGGFILTGAATLAQYQELIATLQYTNSLDFPTSTDRVITVKVNDGISDSNTAFSRLSFLSADVPTVNKQLYLSDPGQGMDRIDPVATGDTTTSSVAVVPMVSNDSTGMATWGNESSKNLNFRIWTGTGYGPPRPPQTTDGSKYITMASAASEDRNEAIVVGVTDDRHVSGAVWNGTAWTPIAINIGGTVKQDLGRPSDKKYWGAAVAYETNSGRAVLVWNTGSTLNYSIWNGTSWTPAATIPAYTGVEPRQIRIASNPLAGSNEIVITVTDKNEVDRALVWNGSAWGNQVQLDNNGGHNFTDANVVYEQQSGRAMVVYASGTAGAVGYQIWNGSAWSSAATIAAPAGSSNEAQWTVVAADPNSNRIVLGVQSNGKDAWMNVWSGTAWGTSTLGVQDEVDQNNNLNIAVAFESKSGDALVVYENDENTNTTEMSYRTFTAGAWSAPTNFGAFANKDTRAITLSSNPYSDQIQLMVNDDDKILRSDLWTGTSFAGPIQLEANTGTTDGQPFSFFWDSYLPGTVTTTTTFTQTTPMALPFVVPTGAAVKVTTYIQLTSGTLPAAPNLAMTLSHAGGAMVTLPAPPTVTNLGGGFFKLEWTGTVPNNVVVPAGEQISLTLTDFDSSYSFNILYDSSTRPSQVEIATATGIEVTSLGVYGAPFPGGSPLTTTPAGQPAFVRFTISDPFGAADITSADVVIQNSSGGAVLSTTLTSAVESTPGSKTYEIAWTPPAGDTFTITVTAHEGTEGVTATGQTTIIATATPDLVVSKSDSGASVSAGGTVAYTINFSNAGLANATGVVLTEFLPDGATFNAAASTPGWVAISGNEFRFAVNNLAAGGSGSVVFAVTVPSPVPSTLEILINSVNIADDGTHGTDPNPTNNSAVDSTPVNAAPDLAVTKTDGGTSTLAGGIVLYLITYSNIGAQDAYGVVISETLPANTTFNSTHSFGAWDDVGGGEFSLVIGDLPAGASGTATFAVTVNDPLPGGVTQILNTVSIADGGGGGPDLNPANNTGTDTTPIQLNPIADLQITKTNGLTSLQPGTVVTYTITVTNAGPNAVTGASFTDNFPAALTGVSYTTTVSGGAAVTPVSGSGNSIGGSLNLPVGGTVIYSVTGTVDSNATGTLANFATVLPPAGTLDPNTGNDTAVDSDPIVPVADLSLNKSFTFTDLDGSGTLTPTPGDRIVFAVTVTNSGPNPAYNVTVSDLLPNGYQYVSDDALGSGGAYAIGNGLWTVGSTIGATAPNNTAVLHITAIVGPGGTYTNEAEIFTSDSFDPDSTPGNFVPTEDDFAAVTPPVQPKSDLSLDKIMALTSDVDGNDILSIGDTVTFTLTLSNLGPNDAASVHVADLLPAGYAYFDDTSSQGTYTSATGDWDVGTVSVLSAPTLTIVATVVGGQPASAYTNYAQVSASGSFDPDSAPGDGSTADDDDALVRPLIADVSVTKTTALAPGGDVDASGNLTIGDQVIFTITVTNSGPDFATGVQLTDLLADGFIYEGDDSPGTYDPVTGLWNIGVVAPGTTLTLNITATVNATGSYTNTAQLIANEHFDPDSTPNNDVPTEDDQSTVTLTPGATAQPPVAVNDSSLHNPPGPVTLNVTTNDTDPNFDLNVASVDLNPGLAGQQTTRFVPGEGTWSVDATGNVTFTPASGFTQDPTPITYTVQDSRGTQGTSNTATITIDYVPVATNDSSAGNTTGTAVTVPVLSNDTTGDATVPSTVQIVGTPAPGASLVVPGEGTWSVNTATGAITFAPAAGFTGDPTPIQYTVQDNDGNTSNPATVTVDFVQFPPQAVDDSSLDNQPGPVTLNVTGNDTDPNNDVDPSTVDLDPGTPGPQTTLVVPGEGFWQVDSTGNVTFFPNVGFTENPAPINYTVKDKTGLQSNEASITITYVPQADLGLAKTVDNATPNVGDTITFTVTLINNGPNNATGILVSDQLPPGLTFVSATPTLGTYSDGTGEWNVGTLNDGASATLILRARVDAITARTNTATITASGAQDTNPANDTASVTETPQLADLAVAKMVSNATPNVGDQITFTVTLSNNGPNAATGVTLEDLLPVGLTFVSATTSQGAYNSGTGLWTVGAVNPGTPQTLTINATVVSPFARTNIAAITDADQFDPNPDNNSASATETPQRADLVIVKTVSDSKPNVGDQINFTLVVANTGPDTATGVIVTDQLPGGVTFVSATASQGAYDNLSGVWTVGTVTTAVNATLTIIVTVDAPGQIENTAKVDGDQFDPNTGNNSSTTTHKANAADLAIVKSVSDAQPDIGEQITYTLTVANIGPDTATNVIVTDQLPAGVTFVSATASQGDYDEVSGIWTVGTIDFEATATLDITVTVTSVSAITNTATVTGEEFDPNTANNTDSTSTDPQSADLALVKTVSNPTPNVGEQITFTVTLRNSGPNTATGVQVTDLLPDGLTFVSADPSQGTYTEGNGVWDVGAVAVGASVTLDIVATVDSPDDQTNTATVTDADQPDPNAANNTASAIESPQQADLAISKSVSNPTPNVGDEITFTVTLSNSGPNDATGVQVLDLLPAGLTFISATPSQGDYDDVNGLWDVGTVSTTSPETLTITVRVDSPQAQTNIATIDDADQFDPDPSDNSGSVTETPQLADLVVAKTVSDATPNVGDIITFTVTVTNQGPDTATNVQITDVLPPGLTPVLTLVQRGTFAGQVWDVGTLAPGASATLTFHVRVDSPVAQTNIATVTNADQFDPNTANNTGSATETPEQADLALAKLVSDPTPNVGDQITFTITLTNSGPDTATGVTVDDLLPAGLIFVSAAPSQGSYDPAFGVWNVGAVSPGTPLTLMITATVNSAVAQTNTVTIGSADQFDPNTANNSASATETPQQADLALTKIVSDATPNVGDQITFTITLTNNGPDDASGVRVADLLPPGLTFVSADPSQGVYLPGSGVWIVGAVTVGFPETLAITARVDVPDAKTNTATISASDQFDPNAANDSASATETPQQADLALTKTVNDDTPNVGDEITFTVTLTNNGPDVATGVQVTDLLPLGLTFVSAIESQGSYNSGTGLWDVGIVSPGTPLTLDIVATVVSPIARTNTARVSDGDQFDPDGNNNEASVTETPQRADLAVTKSVSDPTPNVGDLITFTVTLTNNGPDDATGVQVTDLLPAGLTPGVATPSQGTYGTGVWDVGAVASGAVATLTLTATVVSPDPRTNTATITDSDQFDAITGNNTASATETPERADLALLKTVNDPAPNVGDQIVFTITLTNAGPDTATGVEVTDVLPAGLAFVSAIPSQGTYADGTGVWTVGTVTTTTPATLLITATVVSAGFGANTAGVTDADQFDPNTANNTDTADVNPQQADLALTKTVSDFTPNVGDVITFTVTLTNGGPNLATGVQVTDLLPSGLTFVSSAGQGTYNSTTGVWDVGTIAGGAQVVLLLRATVVSPAAQTNTATISASDQFDPNPGNNTASATETPQQADLRLTKSVSDATPDVDDIITFTITLTDLGPDAATNVIVTDLLPAGLAFVSAIPSQGVYNSATGAWNAGAVAPTGAATLQIDARVDSPGARTNTATISRADQFDPITANNSASATETPLVADLALTKTVSDSTPNVGDVITFTVTLTNNGPDTATGVQVTDILPPGLAPVSGLRSQGNYDPATGIWNVGTIDAGASVTLTLLARVDSSESRTNTATITASDRFDPDSSNNQASATETPEQADLQLAKAVDNDRPNVGDTITFTVTLTNAGPDDATNVELRDLLPAGLTFVSAAPAQGAYSPGSGLWQVGTVAASATTTLTIRATVVSPGSRTNTATVAAADQFDPITGNNTASVTESPQQSDVVVFKRVSDPTPNVGDIITFTITVTNAGPDNATGVTVQDLLPPGVAFLSAVTTQGNYNPTTGVWTVGTVLVEGPQRLTITATVVSPDNQINTVSVADADQFDPNIANNTDTSEIDPPVADLLLTKSVSDATPNVGDTITFTVTLTNNGPNAATGVQVTDLLPVGLTFVSATPAQGTYSNTTGIWNVGAVAGGAQTTLAIVVTVVSPLARTNTATITDSDQFDPNTANNTASATETPQRANLGIDKTVSDTTPNVGDQITFTVTLTNSGPDDATNVTVTDLLPAGLTFVSANPSQGSYTPATGLWVVGTVVQGTPQALEIVATVVSPDAQTNTATVSDSDQFDPFPGNNTDSVTETPQRADLAVAKSVDKPTPNVGDEVIFTVTLTNLGPDAATGVSLTDLLPAGLTLLVATPSQGAYTSATGLWAVGNVAATASATLTLLARVVSPAAQTNTATVADADQFDPDQTNNTASATETPQQADLAVSKSVSDAAPNVGDTITFTITLINNGPDAATNVTVLDVLPAGLTFGSAIASQGSYDAASGLWTVGTVGFATPQTLQIQATVSSPDALTNTAAVNSADQFDPDTGNNQASVTETPQQADLALAKTVSDTTPNVGEEITFTITLTNSGPDVATNVRVTDLLPAGLTFVSAAPSQGSYDDVTGLWDVGTAAPGAPQTLAIVATVVSPAAQTNTATIDDADQFDPDPGDNSSSVTETPQRADLAVLKTVDNATPNVGDEIVFTITVTNSGPDDATDVELTDQLPDGLTFVSADPSQGAYDDGTGVWTVGTVTTATPATLTITARVGSAEFGANTATITDVDQFDPNPDNNTDTVDVDPQRADLGLLKSVSDTTPNVGDQITFTVTLTNGGLADATGVQVTDLLPAGLTFVSANPGQGSYDDVTGIWDVGALANGAQTVLTITATVVSAAARTNTATITDSDQFDPNPGNNTASATETPQRADLAIAKAVSDATPNVGDQITFTITLNNSGPDAATGVQVTDLLPAGLTFVSANPSQDYDALTGVWTVGTVTPGTPQTLTIVATVTSPDAQTNTAAVTDTDQFDPDPGDNISSVTVTPQQADLVVAKAVSNTTPNVGEQITFTVTLTNNGPDAATGVQVTDLLPAGLDFVAATAGVGAYNGLTGLWNVGMLASGAGATLLIQARVVSPDARTNTARITAADQFDPEDGNNEASVTETPQQADLAVSKLVSDPTPNVGDTITFTVTLTNNGPDDATGVVVNDLLPAGLTFVTATTSQGIYASAAGAWLVGAVTPGSPQTLTIQARVISPAAQTNTATITGADQFDPEDGNNTASATETPQQADLALAKSVSDSTPNVGDTITFTVTLTNNGPDSATGVVVNDLLPPGLTFVTASPSQGTYSGLTGVWTVGDVGTTTPETLTITATVVSPVAQTNTATISAADQFDPNAGNNTASATETPQRADLALAKSVSDSTPNIGDTITFTVTLTNNGPDPATGVKVTDLLPTGLAFVSADPSQGSYTSGLWDVGTVTPGTPLTLEIVATVESDDAQTNTASITDTDQFDPITANDTAHSTVIPQQADLAVTKTVSNALPNVADTITFTITLTNNGPDTATGVVVNDVLPAGLAFVSATASRGAYNASTGVWTVNFVSMAEAVTLTIAATVVSAVAQTNTATIGAADQFDPNLANNTSSVTVTPLSADLQAIKTVNKPRVFVGAKVTFTVRIVNRGPGIARSVIVNELLPRGLVFVSARPSQGTFNRATRTWSVGNLASGDNATLQIVVRVRRPRANVNVAIVSAATVDPFLANNLGAAVVRGLRGISKRLFLARP